MDLRWKPDGEHVPSHDLRASDADRERVVDLLQQAYGDGRITLDEHTERVERAYTARTLGELAALTRDLVEADRQPIRVDRTSPHALFTTVRLGGRWVVPVRLPVTALFGTVEIDLREALLRRRHVVLWANVLGGRVRLLVPEGVRVEFTGRSFIGVRDLRVRHGEDAPLIEVSGMLVFGSVSARTPRRRARRSFRRRR